MWNNIIKTNIFYITTFCCIANVMMSSTGCKSFSRGPESWTSKKEKMQLTIIDKYVVRELSVGKALAELSELCGRKSGNGFGIIIKCPPNKYNKHEYKEPLVTLSCRSMTVGDIIQFITEQTNVFIEFTPMALVVDYSRNSQGGERK